MTRSRPAAAARGPSRGAGTTSRTASSGRTATPLPATRPSRRRTSSASGATPCTPRWQAARRPPRSSA
eukprot:8879341-Alexandrium_andersonii.AAC.1